MSYRDYEEAVGLIVNRADEIIKAYYSVTVREEEYSYDLAGNRLTERAKRRYTD